VGGGGVGGGGGGGVVFSSLFFFFFGGGLFFFFLFFFGGGGEARAVPSEPATAAPRAVRPAPARFGMSRSWRAERPGEVGALALVLPEIRHLDGVHGIYAEEVTSARDCAGAGWPAGSGATSAAALDNGYTRVGSGGGGGGGFFGRGGGGGMRHHALEHPRAWTCTSRSAQNDGTSGACCAGTASPA